MSRRRGRHHLRRRPAMDAAMRQRVERAADLAFDTGAVVVVDNVAVVPDVVVEAHDEFPKQRTYRIVRDDGRWADLYRAPRGEAA